MTNFVYWIHHKDHTNVFNDGYVGVTKNIKLRFNRHHKHCENEHLKNAILKYGWDNLIKQIIVIADEKYCYDLETKLRPKKQIGWNIAEGGCKPPICKPRGEGYVSPLKGKHFPTPWMMGRKNSEKSRQAASERKKVKVKYDGKIYESFTELSNFLGLKLSTLANRIYRNPQKWGYEVIK